MAERRHIDWRCRRVARTSPNRISSSVDLPRGTEIRARAKDPDRGGRARRVAPRTMPMRRGRTSAPWFGAGGGSALPCGRVLLAGQLAGQISSGAEKFATDHDTCLMTQKSLRIKSAGHPRRRLRLPIDPDLRAGHSSTRPRDVTKARIERHPTLASYEANPASNVRLLTRPALGTCSRDPASAVPSRPAPAAPFRRTPDRRRSHLFPQVIRLKRDTERSK